MDQYFFFTGNGFDNLEQYLTEIYGERGAYKHNLQRYVQGDYFHAGCRNVNSIDDIPEITFEEIKLLVKREEDFLSASQRIQIKYDELNKANKLADDDYLEIAGSMGLAPSHVDRIDTFFPNVLDLYVHTKEEEDQILQSVKAHGRLIATMVNSMMDYVRSQHIVHYNGRDLVSLGYARNYYRGENKYYGSSRPSMFRGFESLNQTECELEELVRTIKIVDFAFWLTQLDCVQKWPHGDMYHGAIAQHYGIATNGMDVTSDLKIALFFACCYYDPKQEKWYPVSKNALANSDKAKDIGYGILYCAPADIAEMSRVANIENLHITHVTPVGIQPFQRCEKQSAFIIEAGRQYNMLKDHSFAKVKFKQTPEICEWIYEKMQDGELVYPNEGNANCKDIADTISASMVHTHNAFDYAINNLGVDIARKDELLERLAERGYEFREKMEWCTPERQAALEEDYINSIRDISPTFRIGFCI